MRETDRQAVRGMALFAKMRETNFRALTNAGGVQTFPPRALLAREGDAPDFLHVLLEGAVEQFATHNDRETTIEVLTPPATFMLATVIREEVYLKSARTLTESRLLMLPADMVRDVFGRDTAFGRAVVGELAQRYCGVVRALKNQKLRSSTERLANWVLCMDDRTGHSGRFILPFEKRLLASLLGMTPENLSRGFATLAEYGVVGEGRAIVVKDRDALRRMARENPLIDEWFDNRAAQAQEREEPPAPVRSGRARGG